MTQTSDKNMNSRQTIAEIQKKLEPIVGIPHNCPLERNKGKVGHLLEDLLGIPRSSVCLDCSDGEVKTFPLKKEKNGNLTPKETIAVTMLSQEGLRNEEFCQSRCFQKMENMLVIPYLRDGDTITFYKPTLIQCKDELLTYIQKDYNEIRSTFLTTGELHSETGTYLQNRTKGPGGEKKTRAYYLRTSFLNAFVEF